MASKRKYRINEMLENLPLRKNMAAIKMLPKVLQVSAGTFYNYRSINIEDVQDIPHEKVEILEQFFGLEPGELRNYDKPSVRPIKDLSDDDIDIEIAGETFGLSKPA